MVNGAIGELGEIANDQETKKDTGIVTTHHHLMEEQCVLVPIHKHEAVKLFLELVLLVSRVYTVKLVLLTTNAVFGMAMNQSLILIHRNSNVAVSAAIRGHVEET